MREEFQIVEESELPSSEGMLAAKYWSEVDTSYYQQVRPWTLELAKIIEKSQPKSVFEFGCNAGKNLKFISENIENTSVFGVDINLEAVLYARNQGVNVALGDQFLLNMLPDDYFDISFTVSVLDHLADPLDTIKNLIRLSKVGVVFCEPWLGEEGKIAKNMSLDGSFIDTTPFSYSWNYAEILRKLGQNYSVYPVNMKSNLGRYYNFYSTLPK